MFLGSAEANLLLRIYSHNKKTILSDGNPPERNERRGLHARAAAGHEVSKRIKHLSLLVRRIVLPHRLK